MHKGVRGKTRRLSGKVSFLARLAQEIDDALNQFPKPFISSSSRQSAWASFAIDLKCTTSTMAAKQQPAAPCSRLDLSAVVVNARHSRHAPPKCRAGLQMLEMVALFRCSHHIKLILDETTVAMAQCH